MVVTPRHGRKALAPEQDKPTRQAVTAPAPGRLELVRAFVNTLDIEAGTDELSSPAALAAWLRERDLTGPAASASPATEADLRQAIAMREALRAVLLTHVPAHHAPASDPPGSDPPPSGPPASGPPASGPPPSSPPRPPPSGPNSSALAELRSVAEGLATRLTIADDGSVRTAPAGQGPAHGLAGLMLIAAEAATSGTWDRLKVCSADDCRWAFYDRSPTRSGCWCSMAVCGSRAKSRAFRRRAAGPPRSRTA
jgi:predicted RNA-binding Zn ribbon-like protein